MQNSDTPQNVVLESSSPDETGDIVMRGGLVAVGRHEPPFSESRSTATARMSRRHARVFVESGNVYIVDLGSSNGTTVNGTTIGRQPVRLFNGDEIEFAGQFRYVLKVPESLEAHTSVAQAPTLKLTLKPQSSDLDTVIVSRFSFLVGKNSDLFAPYRDAHARELAFLSRRHAHVYEQGGDLYIEDLGSTNGTYVNGERLDEHARKLQPGDSVGFGGDFFVYKVAIDDAGQAQDALEPAGHSDTRTEAAPQNVPPTERDAEAKTTFVSTASSFLDIFYDQQDDAAQGEEAGEQPQPGAAPGAGQAAGGRVSFMGRVSASIDELRGDAAAEKTGSRRLPLVAAGLLVAVLVGAWFYFQGESLRDIRQLVEAGDYRAAALRADAWLDHHPDDNEVQRLANKALLNAVVPEWSTLTGDGRYEDAHKLLTDAAAGMAQHNRDGQNMLALLGWMTDLDRYHKRKQNTPGAVTIFEDEIKIGELIALWENDTDGHRLLLSRMSQLAPALEPGRLRASSQLTRLYGERSGFVEVIEELKTNVVAHLAAGNDDAVAEAITRFEQKYPTIQGMEILHRDIATYTAYRNAIDEQDVAALWELSAGTQFSTPLFKDAFEQNLKPDLPPHKVLQRYADAADAWRKGDVDGSLQILDDLLARPWGAVAAQLMELETRIVTAFDALEQARGSETYDDQLRMLHALLKPGRDDYYLERTGEDFNRLRDSVLGAAQSDIDAAGTSWSAYLEQGGLTGLLRLEEKISDQYRQLTSLLAGAKAASQNALDAYQSVAAEPPAELVTLGTRVSDEILRQRAWLQELDVILPPSLLQQKLDLLPEP
jgi:pSer/pThr/pTyr-binding forkhead associated (FHA) protein